MAGENWSRPGSWPAACARRSSWEPGAPRGRAPRSSPSRAGRSAWWGASSASVRAGSESSRTSTAAAPATRAQWPSASSSPTPLPTAPPLQRRRAPCQRLSRTARSHRRHVQQARPGALAHGPAEILGRQPPRAPDGPAVPAPREGDRRDPTPGADRVQTAPEAGLWAMRIAPSSWVPALRTWQTCRREAHSCTPRSHRGQCHAGTRHRLPRKSPG